MVWKRFIAYIHIQEQDMTRVLNIRTCISLVGTPCAGIATVEVQVQGPVYMYIHLYIGIQVHRITGIQVYRYTDIQVYSYGHRHGHMEIDRYGHLPGRLCI